MIDCHYHTYITKQGYVIAEFLHPPDPGTPKKHQVHTISGVGSWLVKNYYPKIDPCTRKIVLFIVCEPYPSIDLSLNEPPENLPNSHVITVSLETLKKADRFAKDIAKVKGTSVRDEFVGKTGEVAVKCFLKNLISDVDFQIHAGDGGTDFCLVRNKDIGIQVKTTSERNEWFFSEYERLKNAVYICVSTEGKESIEDYTMPGNYDLSLIGWIPTASVNQHVLTKSDLRDCKQLENYLKSSV